VGRVSVVGIAIFYGLNSPGITSQSARFFQHMSRPALGPIQLPVQWELGLFQRDNAPGCGDDHPALSRAEVKEQSYTFIPPLGLCLLQQISPLRLQIKTIKWSRTHEYKTTIMTGSIYT
jgi:hypothetical protein